LPDKTDANPSLTDGSRIPDLATLDMAPMDWPESRIDPNVGRPPTEHSCARNLPLAIVMQLATPSRERSVPTVCVPAPKSAWFGDAGTPKYLCKSTGEPGWDRTNDPLIKSQMLYR
jgi:hypothetical protein